MKIRICTFDIAKYGGIIQNVESRVKAFKEMGHDVDIIFLRYQKTVSQSSFDRKLAELESGKFQDSKDLKSQNGGYSKSPITGYWRNSYYGWHLPPETNSIPVFHENALEMWHEAVDDCDIVFWSFMPTKTGEAKGFKDWPKFFDLPKTVNQIMAVHDGYFDVRSSWVRYLSDKIKYLDCVHVSAYNSVENIAIPRYLNFASRYIPEKLTIKSMKDKSVDFFAAHVFKSMKKMEELVSAVAYLKEGSTTFVAGSGIELYYMIIEDDKQLKPNYAISRKKDPDCRAKDEGKSIWRRALKNGMEYAGFLSNEDVYFMLQNSKFAIDPSFSKHYAQYSHTHLNGFTIEAVINGCYPVLRDTKGLVKDNDLIDDVIFRELKAIYIPWDATPKQFADILNEAKKMPDIQYKKDIIHNFNLAKRLFDPIKNMSNVIRLATDKKERKALLTGVNSDRVILDSEKTMTEFFNCKVPIEWER